MPIRYRKDGSTHDIYLYPSNQISGEGVHPERRLAVRQNGTTRFVGVSTNLSHPLGSDIFIYADGVPVVVLRRSHEVTQTEQI